MTPSLPSGGILITNRPLELATAQEIDKLFYEVLIAPDYTDSALELLSKKKKRVLLQYHHLQQQPMSFKSLLNGVIDAGYRPTDRERQPVRGRHRAATPPVPRPPTWCSPTSAPNT